MTATVRTRLLRLVALLVLPGLAISAALTWRVYLTARAGAQTALHEAAHGLDQLVDRTFVEADVLLRTLAATSELQRGDMADFDRLARATVIANGAIVLTDAAGRELIDTSLPAGSGLPTGAPSAAWQSEQLGHPRIQPVSAASQAGHMAVRVVLPVGVAGNHAYDLTLILPADALQSLLVRSRMPSCWTSSIIDPQGVLAARSDPPACHVDKRPGPAWLTGPAWFAGLGESREGTRDDTVVDGARVVLAYSRSAWSGWTVAVAAPSSVVAASGRQSIALLALLGTAAILAGVVAASRVARRIARPIEALAQAARTLGEGGSWAPIPAGLAEVDAVNSAMQAAARSLADRQAALADLNAGLSARVDARTADLAAANMALDAQRRTLADILDQMPLGVLVRRPDHTLVYINLQARRLLHLPAEGLPEPTWPVMRQAGQILSLEETPGYRACHGIATERVLISVCCADGSQAEAEVSASPLRDAEGSVTHAVTVFQDVTARIAAEEARRRSQRLEAVGQLTGGVAHEFNNLLLAVTGCLDLLGKPLARLGDARANALLANAARAAGRGSRLTTQLLAFARRQTLQMEPVDLNVLVLGMRELLEGTLGGAVQVEVIADGVHWPAMADAAQVELMLLNLAINARDAMPNGGLLTIRTGCVSTSTPNRAEDPPEGEHAVFHVADTGHGMPAQVLARAFEPFFTTKPVGSGSGLGLPQVLGVAQQMGGGVTIDSHPGDGTTVSVFLPRAPAGPGAPQQGAPAMRANRGTLNGIRVLMVDDDPDVRLVTTAILEELGATVTEADSGAAALLALRTGPIDLVLADLAMPVMTGLQLAAETAVLFPALPVVLMTGYGPAALVDPGPNIRATLQKPFRADALAREIIAAFGRPAVPGPAAPGDRTPR